MTDAAETHTGYEVHVVDWLWEGTKGTYQYEFVKFPTLQDVRAKAGDFESLDDYEVVKISSTFTPTPKGYTRTTETEIVRSWDSDVSADVYSDSTVA